MRPSHSSALPLGYRNRADWTALIAGILAFLSSAVYFRSSQTLQPSSLMILAFLAALSGAAGFVAVSNAMPGLISQTDVVYSLRTGARAGALSALIGAGMIVMAARFFGSPPTAMMLLEPCALSILPSSLGGVLTAAVAAGVRLPRLPAARRADAQTTGRGFICFAAVLSAAGFLSILVPQHLPPINSTWNQFGGAANLLPQPTPSLTPDTRDLAGDIRERLARESAGHNPFEATPTPTARLGMKIWDTPSPSSTQGFPRQLHTTDDEYQRLYAFIADHHEKINRGDLGALTADYDDWTIYLQHGSVDRSNIYRIEAAFLSNYRQYREVIMQPVEIDEIDLDRYRAHYKIVYDANKRNNQHITGMSDVYLFVRPYSHGFFITRQQNHPN